MPINVRVAAPIACAIGAVLLFAVPRLTALPQNPDGWGLGPYQTTPVFTGLAAVLVVGAAVARWSPVGAAIAAGSVAVVIVMVVVVSLRPTALLLGGPALAAVILALRGRGIVDVALVLIGVVVVAGAFGWWAHDYYDERYGPTHPASTVPGPDWPADWMWVGGVLPDRAVVTAGGLDSGSHQLRYWRDGDTGDVSSASDEVARYGVARFELDGLRPGTLYNYELVAEIVPRANLRRHGSFTTPDRGPQDLTIVLGVCARTGSNGAVFDSMRAEEPDMYLNLGDLHYGNLVSDDPQDHLRALSRALSAPAQAALVSTVPTTWVWDDHDFGDNDSDSSSPSRDAVSQAYRIAAPHHDVDPDPAASIAQAFTIGRVRFVVTDTRSMRTSESMLGADQLEWFIDELITSSQSHAAVIWVNPAAWITGGPPGGDQWGGFPEERRTIADAIAAAGIENLAVISGDFHMTAIDDGSNTGFATDGSPGFPLLHAGPLDRPGGPAGGPYSHGAFHEGGQYGKVEITDDGGSTIAVRLSGHRWDGAELVALDLTFPVGGDLPAE